MLLNTLTESTSTIMLSNYQHVCTVRHRCTPYTHRPPTTHIIHTHTHTHTCSHTHAHILINMFASPRSVSYRTIKLFFIGNGERGKTTLLRRLRSLPNEAIKNPERTTGIDIEEWSYPPRKSGTLGRSQSSKNPVQFLAWDFAGQVSAIYMYLHCRR